MLLRAEAYAAADDHGAVLETLSDLISKLDPRHGSSRAIARRAVALARATPKDDRELVWLRTGVLRRFGLGVDGQPVRRR